MAAIFHAEAETRANLRSYKQLAQESGMTENSVKQLMAILIREARNSTKLAYRGADKVDLEELVRGLRA